jgi:hypothetical protein
MRYTPYYLRLTAEKYNGWLATVTDGTECLFQEFAPKGDSCLDHKIEGWTFTAGYFRAGRFFETHGGGSDRILHNGGAIYYGAEKHPWGEVFQARIVPINNELKSSDRVSSMPTPPFMSPSGAVTNAAVFWFQLALVMPIGAQILINSGTTACG